MKVEIFDPPMCCPSGLCGPGIDPVLLRVNEAVLALKKQGMEVERYNLARQPKAFMDNHEVKQLLAKNGKNIMPVVMVNGEVIKTGEYPSYENLCQALGIEPLKQKTIPLFRA